MHFLLKIATMETTPRDQVLVPPKLSQILLRVIPKSTALQSAMTFQAAYRPFDSCLRCCSATEAGEQFGVEIWIE